MRNKKIAIIGTVGLPAKYGGWETLVDHLTIELREDFDFTVYCTETSYTEKLDRYNGAKLEYLPLRANGIQSIPYDIWSIFKALRNHDTILILGVSGCIILPFLKLFNKKRIIVNIDGLEWKRDKWNDFAKWFLRYSEKLAVKNADIVVVDNTGIEDYVKDTYQRDCLLLEYGGDCADFKPREKGTHYFSVCRIEPENNIHVILEAFSVLPDSYLKIVGNWNNSDYGKELKLKYKKFANLELIDPIYNRELLDNLRASAKVYIHGHSAGGTNPSLVEAMYLELPIIAFDVNFNKYTTENKAIYFKNADDLVDKINSLEEVTLTKVAHDMKEIADRRYTWKIVAEKYKSIL